MERMFEGLIWNSRLVVLFAVVASLVAALGMFYVATVDTVYMVAHLMHYADPSVSEEARKVMYNLAVAHVVEIVDGYLLATVLLIFSFGLYELFISKIDQATESESSSNILLIRNLDDLKARLAKVILIILIVSFFKRALTTTYQGPLDLLYLAGGIALIGLALYLAHASEEHRSG
ncbi:MAG: YqhA family protein [Acidiferrobacterales bacterium]